MKRVIALVVFLASFAFPAFAQEQQCLKWTHPGGDVNQRTLEETVADLGLPTKEDEAKVYDVLRRSVVQTSDILAEIAKLGNKTERERLTKLVRATKKQFFAKEAVEKLLPAELAQTVIVNANLDTSLYESEVASAGYAVDSMVFGRDKKATCVVFQPAPGQPQQVLIHNFTVELSDGNEWTIAHSTICSNAGKKKKSKRVAKTAPIKTKPPRDSFTHRVVVWKILDPAFKAEISGKQSRNIGALVNEALEAGRIQPLKDSAGIFEFELHDLNWAQAVGSKVGVNNNYNFTPGAVLPTNFAENNSVEVPVVDGEGQLTFERKITNEASYLIIRAPSSLKPVYPKGGALYTCVAKTGEKCGGADYGKWHREVQALPWLRSNFFVE
ncbi:MAG: hypothetical protein HY432_03585 [Candidatus Liptonbacteria bacterium]|nr:hypothetical protein [Candidatus Liptonbacteria bacterium]